MDPSTERRDSRRLFLGPEHSIHFLLKGHAFREIRITNVSLGGCFAMVSQRDQGLFTQGAVLEQLGFEHPDLPRGPITAQVLYAIGGQQKQPCLDFMGIGISFVSMAPEIRDRLSVFLETMLGI
jgi:hypothetical protein